MSDMAGIAKCETCGGEIVRMRSAVWAHFDWRRAVKAGCFDKAAPAERLNPRTHPSSKVDHVENRPAYTPPYAAGP